MIRTAAALFAKKTAIVAISGVVVIGGAGLALASTDVIDPPADESVEDQDTTADGETGEDTTTTTDTTIAEGEGEDEGVEEEGTEDEGDGTEDDGLAPTDAGEDDELAEDAEDETPDNHGAAVSQAAKDCHAMVGDGEGQYRNHGQCVRATANKNAAPPVEEEPPAEEQVVEEPAEDEQDVEEPAEEEPAAATAEAPGGKPAHAGPPAGKGGGKK